MRTPSILAVMVAALGVLGCASHPTNVLPDQIQGHWVTNRKGYETRYLQLERDFVLIGVEPDVTPSIQRVYRVEEETNGRQVTYKIYSTGAESDYTLTLRYDPANGGEIQLKNQGGIIWKRAAAGP